MYAHTEKEYFRTDEVFECTQTHTPVSEKEDYPV